MFYFPMAGLSSRFTAAGFGKPKYYLKVGDLSLFQASLKGFSGDPVDRLISATALNQKARLVTADDRLLGHRSLKTINGLI